MEINININDDENLFNKLILLCEYCINYIWNFYNMDNKDYTIISDIENNISSNESSQYSDNEMEIDESVFYNIGNLLIQDSWEIVDKKDS